MRATKSLPVVSSRDIRRHIAYVLGFALVFIAVTLWAAVSLNRHVADEILWRYQREQLISVSQQSARLAGMIDHIADDLVILSSLEEIIQFREKPARRRLFEFFKKHQGFLVAGYLMDQTGRLRMVEGLDRTGEGQDISHQAHVQKLLRTKASVVSGSFKAVEGYFAIAIHAPILKDGAVKGSVATLVKWNAFGSWFKKATMSPGSFTMLLDSHQQIVYHPEAEYSGKSIVRSALGGLGRQSFPDDFFTRDQSALVDGPFFKGQQYVLASHTFEIKDTTYTLISCAPYADIVGPMKRLSNLTIVLTCLSLLVVFASAGYILLRYFGERRQWVRFHHELQAEIEDRKQAEAALREGEERYRRFFEDDLSGAFISKPDGRIVACNPAFARMFGFAYPKDLFRIDLYKLYPQTASREAFLKKLRQKGRLENYEATMQRMDGTLIHTIENTVGEFDAQGNLLEIRGYLMDVTERHKLASQLRQAQKMEAIGTLAGGIAHDFNNILASVIGFCQLAMDDTDKGTEVYDCVHEAYLASLRAKELVKQILTFARQSESERKPVRVKLILKEALQFLRSTLPATIAIDLKVNSDTLTLSDPTQIYQVIMNLCSNAGHAMRETGGRLTVVLDEVFLEEEKEDGDTVLAKEPYLKLTVADTGHGFTPEVGERIFEPYFTTKQPGEGSGMGLSVVQGIVQACGGRLTAQGRPGEGATFTVLLPKSTEAEMAEDELDGEIPTGDEHILFVDDEPPLIKMGQRMLERLGYRVSVFTDGYDALDALRADPQAVDLVITDMTMPDITGDVLAQEVIQIRPDLPILILTGYSERLGSNWANFEGVQGVLMKPIVKADLARMIRKALDNK